MDVIEEVAAERRRQVEIGWTPDHDDEHSHGQLAQAAACYATPGILYEFYSAQLRFVDPFPWIREHDSRPYDGNVLLPNDDQGRDDRRRQLIKAAALIVAEIERLDRKRK